MSEAKHRIELLKRDRKNGLVKLKLDGEEVVVEKIGKEEMPQKGEDLQVLLIWTDNIDFGDIATRGEGKDDYVLIPTKPEVYNQRKALAIYRLMWCFGMPSEAGTTDEYSCIYGFKYKGYVFKLMDEPGRSMRIDSRHLVSKEEDILSAKTDKKYAPPKKISEEIISILEYLMKNPVEVYTNGGPMSV
ncbi:MAG: hypothetical protein QXU09_00400 [Thermoproteota archaeon]|nr:hypothetical protein [Candidatus Brockarchaeota archaeon]